MSAALHIVSERGEARRLHDNLNSITGVSVSDDVDDGDSISGSLDAPLNSRGPSGRTAVITLIVEDDEGAAELAAALAAEAQDEIAIVDARTESELGRISSDTTPTDVTAILARASVSPS